MKKLYALLLGVCLELFSASDASSALLFRDDFNDGSLSDPLTQSGPAAPLTYTVLGSPSESGGFLSFNPVSHPSNGSDGAILNRSFTDASIPLNTAGAGFAVEMITPFSDGLCLGMLKSDNQWPQQPPIIYGGEDGGVRFGACTDGVTGNHLSVYVNGVGHGPFFFPTTVQTIRLEVTEISGFTTSASARFRAVASGLGWSGLEVYNERLDSIDLSNNYIWIERTFHGSVDSLEITTVPEPSAYAAISAVGLITFALAQRFRQATVKFLPHHLETS